MSEPQTFTDRIKQSSHPLALLFFLGFRIVSTDTYSTSILEFITVILLLAADFWNVKNISGRLLVGLRWWNETDDNGESIWVFETANPDRQINPVDSNIFWFWLYLTPFVWGVMGILAFLKLEFLSLILVIIGLTLTIINTMAFTRCDKFGKANDLASSVFGTVSGSMFGRLVPSFFRGNQ
ncbi:Golgi apparatus membrane protein TVP23 [Cyberlindnera jadinii]|uniref:Golgi apparatus membrane protein TVP23 n=1 Tax=Cyberlindnera jadinii (strain ATCC 18201 / CBS 1600 / BCRC 20928 / JCM 3617 / NBRC 0987 / NRRL Y-1542) TaxID=983966 RepID=A0A0H5C574_CYBJN|nr:Golgi apparatus membrane protein TVP23 [Cyberlindnera jadinii]